MTDFAVPAFEPNNGPHIGRFPFCYLLMGTPSLFPGHTMIQ